MKLNRKRTLLLGFAWGLIGLAGELFLSVTFWMPMACVGLLFFAIEFSMED